ncbi:putative holin-like toxin [Brevibacillus laterosporus]|nr:putative holin-like toxin [Brevibacillus laterosporus]MED1665124.1 putative holin-like toxin [Brevibacillus laterosporus]MED1670294.1 putative holin-like toxin [Brevibacillus laterosporus]MED1718059.1 putative holin-like toxin [Brevibacillus laterosporus]
MVITHETLSLMIQFSSLIVATLALVVTIVVALTKKK